jgi:hypothetical protein
MLPTIALAAQPGLGAGWEFAGDAARVATIPSEFPPDSQGTQKKGTGSPEPALAVSGNLIGSGHDFLPAICTGGGLAMTDGRGPERPGPSGFTRFGLSREVLAAAIEAELDEEPEGRDAAAVAHAVAAAIEANNEELLRHLNQMLSSETVSGRPVRAKFSPPDVS